MQIVPYNFVSVPSYLVRVLMTENLYWLLTSKKILAKYCKTHFTTKRNAIIWYWRKSICLKNVISTLQMSNSVEKDLVLAYCLYSVDLMMSCHWSLVERTWTVTSTAFYLRSIHISGYTRASFWNFILGFFILVWASYSYCGDKKWSTGFFQITFFKDCKNMVAEQNLWVTINFYEKQCLPAVTRNKKHLSEQVVTIT